MTARPASAADVAVPGTATPVEIHGFASPGFLISTDNNYLARSKRGSFEFTETGLNFTVQLTEKLRTGMQLFARQLGKTGGFTPRVDWFYLDYKLDDAIGFRAGRVKLPYGLYNDTSDIDAARVPVLLPQSVYPTENRDFLLAQTGAELYSRARTSTLGSLDYRFYAGTIALTLASQTTVGTAVTDIDIPYVVGQRLIWETPLEGLRVAGSLQALKLDAQFTVQGKPLSVELPVILSAASIEYAAKNVVLAAEYSRWFVRSKSSNTTMFPDTHAVSERAYVMASRRFTKWFQPGIYYSLYFPSIHQRSGPAASQHDVAATLRFDLNPYWLVKLEGHYMNGTAVLSAALNDNRPATTLERSWGLFLVKTTAHF